MNYQLALRIGFPVNPIPKPREQVRHLMQATAAAVDGPVETRPERIDPRLAHWLIMTQANLAIAGTGCKLPLLLREAMDLSAAASLDTIVVRVGAWDSPVTFDVNKVGNKLTLCGYRLWMRRPSHEGWLVPTAGEEEFIELTPFGLKVQNRAPYGDGDGDLEVGLLYGTQYLSAAKRGWF